MKLEDGSKLQVVELPMPDPLFYDGYRLPASYANFYISNGCVIVPTFNDRNDRLALGTLAELFPDREVVGIPILKEFGDALYGTQDPAQHFYRGRPYSVARSDGEYVLSVDLPFTTKDQISLSRHADELVIDLGEWRRNLVLPRALIDAAALGAQFEDHILKIRFAAPERMAAQRRR